MSTSARMTRRHDLDALRAFAMLLGVGLHVALAYSPFIPWPVKDVNQNPLFLVFFTSVHGFRMQLFFLVSGFFTAMLWRRRGLKSLLKHRAARILVPCLVGLVTVVPALDWANDWAMSFDRTAEVVQMQDDRDLIGAVRTGNREAVARLLDDGASANRVDGTFRNSALAWAALRGDVEIVRLLLDHGARLDSRGLDGSTPLHGAAFLGRADVVRLLVERGADPQATNNKGETAAAATLVDWHITRFLGGLFQVPMNKREIYIGRAEIREQLNTLGPIPERTESTDEAKTIPQQYMAAISSERLMFFLPALGMDEPLHLVHTPVFHHLWFLWFLCWLVMFFAAFAWLADKFAWRGPPQWLVVSPARMLWLIPLTLAPQWFMGLIFPTFGPDTSVGVLPQPHVLLYYGVFFAFGALYYHYEDPKGLLGAWWFVTIPAAILLAYPVGMISMQYRPVGAVAQVLYAWWMTFGMMGLFRFALHGENRTLRYLSDSSYWLYIAHVPLVIVVQQWVRDWSSWSFTKFFLVTAVVTLLLLVVYQLAVRHTLIGRMLNGPQKRPASDSTKPEMT